VAARQTGAAGPVWSPGIQSANMALWEIVLFDVATGQERRVASDVISQEAPVLTWSPASTHILVRSPFWGYGP
jgi:hypothetical protein